MCFNWKSYTYKKQLLIVFSLCSIISLGLITIISLSSLKIIGDNVKNDAETALFDQIKTNMGIVAKESSDLFEKTLQKSTEGFLNPICYSAQNALQPGYNIGLTKSYFEYGDSTLSQPLEQDSRQIKQVSLKNSAYYFPGSNPTNVDDLLESSKTIVDDTAHVDHYFRPVYRDYTDFVAGYIGFEDDGIFRHYPGISTLDTDPDRLYDPRQRGWYTVAKSTKNILYTSPYRDFNGKGWMITIARPILNVLGNIIGVAGSDMKISTIKKNIDDIKFLEGGKASLFETSGQVVADKQWTPNPDSITGYTYQDLINPVISNDNWNFLKQGTNEITEIDGYLFLSNKLTIGNGKYVIVVTVPKSEVTAPLDEVVADIDSVVNSSIVTLLLIFLGIIVFVSFVIVYTTHSFVKPLNNLCQNSDKIANNLGKKDIFEGVELLGENEGLGETKELQSKFNNMIHTIEQSRKTKPMQNPYYHQQNAWNQGIAQQQMYPAGVSVIGIPIPSAPIQVGLVQPVIQPVLPNQVLSPPPYKQ